MKEIKTKEKKEWKTNVMKEIKTSGIKEWKK